MGFALFRARSAGMPTFLTEVLRAIDTSGDDQVAVNEAASLLHIKWIYGEGGRDMR